jgi:c-di-GMP-binding flagellar brake protein YcgR
MRFEELKLPVATRFELIIVGQDYKKHRCEAVLVGFDPGRYITVTLVNKPPQVYLHAGAAVEGRICNAYGTASFSAEIDTLREARITYLDLSYPGAIQFRSLRQFARFPIDTPVEIQAHTALGMTANTIYGHMLDISEQGARIVVEKELTKMVTKISLGVFISGFGLERDISLTAVVRNTALCSRDYPECEFAYGIEFTELEPVDGYFLQAFTSKMQLQQRQLQCPVIS